MRAVKIIAAAAGAVVLLLVVAAVALYAWFDPNDYKDYVTRWAEAQTGRRIGIGDKLELQLFPWLAVATGGITVANAEGFGDEPFATVTHASAEVKLLPLLEKRVEVGTVRLDGLQLHLAEDSNGRGNWEDLLRKQGAAPSPSPSPQPPPPSGRPAAGAPGSAASWLAGVDIAGIRVSDSRVDWRDASGPRYVIGGLDLESGRIRAGGAIDLSAKFSFTDVPGRRSADVEAQTVATLRGKAVELGKTRVDGRIAGAPFGSGKLELALAWTHAAFDSDAGSVAVQDLSTRVDGVEAAWQLTGRDVPTAPAVDGSVSIKSGSAAALLSLLGISPPQGVDAKALGNFDLAASFAATLGSAADAAAGTGGSSQSIVVKSLQGAWLGMTLTGDAKLSGADHLEARLDVPAFKPDKTLLALVRAKAPAGVHLDALGRVGLSGRVDADLATGRMTLADLKADLLGASVTGNLEVVPRKEGSLYRGALKTPRFAPDAFTAFFAGLLSDKIVPSKLGMLAADTGFAYDLHADSLSLDPLAFEAFGLKADGNMTVTNLSGTPILKGRAHVPVFSPRDLLARFGQAPPETADRKALQRAGIDTRFEIDPGRGQFTNLVLALDDSRITGNFTVAGVTQPEYRFALAIDHVDADRYLPPPSAPTGQAGAQAAPPAGVTAGDIELPAEALANLKVDGSVKVGKLKLANLDLDDVSTDIAIGNGEARLAKAGAKLYGGRFDGDFGVKTAGAQPGLTLKGRASGLDLAPLITALTREKANFSGKGDFDLNLTGRGKKVMDNVKSASGNVKFSLTNGAIDGFNLGRTLCAVYNASQKLPAPAAQPKLTRYQVVSGTAAVADGVASSSDLLARAAFMDVKGKGNLKLAEQRLDYTLEAKLTGKVGISGCEPMDQLVGESIPLTLRGTVTDPSISPDFSEIIQRRLKNQLQQRLQNRLEDKLKGLLK